MSWDCILLIFNTYLNVLEARLGHYFLPKYEGLGRNCWDRGCNYNESSEVCRASGGTIAKVRNRHDNQMIHGLLDKLGTSNPDYIGDSFQFYIGLKAMGNDYYRWEDGSDPTFFNW